MIKYRNLRDLLEAYRKDEFKPEDHKFKTIGGKLSVIDKEGAAIFSIRLATRSDFHTDRASVEIGELFNADVYNRNPVF